MTDWGVTGLPAAWCAVKEAPTAILVLAAEVRRCSDRDILIGIRYVDDIPRGNKYSKTTSVRTVDGPQVHVHRAYARVRTTLSHSSRLDNAGIGRGLC